MSEILWRALAQRPVGTLDQLATAAGLEIGELPPALDRLAAHGVAVGHAAGLYWCTQAPAPLQLSSPAILNTFERVELHFSLASTQDRAAELLRAGATTVLVVAEQQAAGRGRSGKAWVSPLGAHLYFSLGWRFDRSPAELQGLSVLIGISLVRALLQLGFPVRLKWPNDLWLHDRKLGGILVELSTGPAGSTAIIGIGLNHRMPASHVPDQAWLDLASCALRPPSREALLESMLAQLTTDLARFAEAGLTPFLSEFARFDALAGRIVEFQSDERAREARAAGITADGRLRLQEPNGGTVLVSSGEVQLLRTQAAPWRLLLDCGNTRLKWAWSALAEPLVMLAGAAVDLRGSSGNYRDPADIVADLRLAISTAAISGAPREVRLASSFGGDRDAFRAALESAFGAPIVALQSPAEFLRWRSAYPEPARLGIDRTLAMWAMLPLLQPGERLLLVSVGSALTLDVLDADGSHQGGLIGPSPDLSCRALAALSRRLDPAGASYCALARRSNDAVLSASLLSAVGLIEHVAREHAVQRVVIGGGGAGPVLALLRVECAVEWLADLPLWGLALAELP